MILQTHSRQRLRKSTKNASFVFSAWLSSLPLHGAFWLCSLSFSVGFPWNLSREKKVTSTISIACEQCPISAKSKGGGEIHVSRERRRKRDMQGAWRVLRVSPDACISPAVKKTQNDENLSNKSVWPQHQLIAHNFIRFSL